MRRLAIRGKVGYKDPKPAQRAYHDFLIKVYTLFKKLGRMGRFRKTWRAGTGPITSWESALRRPTADPREYITGLKDIILGLGGEFPYDTEYFQRNGHAFLLEGQYSLNVVPGINGIWTITLTIDPGATSNPYIWWQE